MTNRIDDLLDRAFVAFNAGDLRLAETLCREAMTVSPTHGDALYLLGLIAYREKALSVAADLLHEALELYPDIPNYQLAFAEVLRAQGHLDEALSFYFKMMDDPKVRTEAGLIYLAQGKKKEAKSCFQEALKKNGTIAPAYLGMASLVNRKKEKEALLLKAYSFEDSENTAYHLARFYVSQKAWLKAETLIKRHLKFSRDWTLYAGILESLKRPDEALTALQKAIELDSYNAGAWVQQGLLLEHQKDWHQAALAYQKALDLDNDLLDAHEGLSNALMAQGNFPMALEHTRYIIRKNPNHCASLYKLAILLEQTDDFEEALGIYFKLLILKPNRIGLEKRIQETILALANKKKHLAKKFAKGWLKSFPDSKWAQKTWHLLKVLILIPLLLWGCDSWSFENEYENLTWEMRYADLGDAESQYNLGQIWSEGKKVPQDLEKAILYYKQAAAQDYIPALMALGKFYEETQGSAVAQSYYMKAAMQDYVPAELIVARYFDKEGKVDEAIQWLEKALKQMFPNAQDLDKVSPEYQRLKEKRQRFESNG